MLSLNSLSKLASILLPREEVLVVSAIESGNVFANEMIASTREKSDRHFVSKNESNLAAKEKHSPNHGNESIQSSAQKFCSIGVLGAKGGVGSSTVALNLALAFGKSGVRSTILDANLQQPDIALMLGRQPDYSISEFTARRGELDLQLWNACRMELLPAERNGGTCSLLSGPASGAAARQTSLSQIAESFDGLREFNDVLLVDLPKNLDKHLVTAIDRLDYLVLVFDGTLASMAAARRWKNIFAELAYPAEKIIYLQNRSGSKSQLPDSASILSAELAAKLPNAYSFLEECCNSAEPAILKDLRQPFSKAISKFAELLKKTAAAQIGRTQA